MLAPPDSGAQDVQAADRRNASRKPSGAVSSRQRGPWIDSSYGALAWHHCARAWPSRWGVFGRWTFGVWCWTIFLLLAVPVMLSVLVLQAPTIERHRSLLSPDLFLALVGMQVGTIPDRDLLTVPHLLLVSHCSCFDAAAVRGPATQSGLQLCGQTRVRRSTHATRFPAHGTLFVGRFKASKSVEDR
ncbi:MAG: hypothetical protein IPN78_03245 [Candidatus Accumulibacter sp.]|nr:hypothetical protein [Candidatus Accumulibacter propinquus]